MKTSLIRPKSPSMFVAVYNIIVDVHLGLCCEDMLPWMITPVHDRKCPLSPG